MSAKFWASPGAEAKRKYRYILDVGKADLESYESWVIQKVNRPSFSISARRSSACFPEPRDCASSRWLARARCAILVSSAASKPPLLSPSNAAKTF